MIYIGNSNNNSIIKLYFIKLYYFFKIIYNE